MMCFPAITKAQLTISSPFDKAVYQRNASGITPVGSATITLAGQCPEILCIPNSYVRYRILNINLSNGATISTYTTWTNITLDARGRFFFTITPNTGWYQIDFQAYFNNGLVNSNITKFGVGDVYIISGQSNAQGINTDANPQPTTVQSGDITYEAVVSCNYHENCLMGNGKMPRFPVFSTLASGTSATSLGNAIAPAGYNNWCYTRLGNRLAALGIPVAFFNAGQGGTSIRNWYDTRLSENDVTPSTFSGTNYCANLTPGIKGEPYATLKKTLRYYGSLFGVRAVLWHQGESDNPSSSNPVSPLVDTPEYKTKLEAVINQSRVDFGSNVPWVVSKASFFNNQSTTTITNAQAQVISGPVSPPTPSLNPLPLLGVETDSYTLAYRKSDQVHFNNNKLLTPLGEDGLRTLGDLWKNILPLNSATSPITASPVQNITVIKSGNSFTLTAPNGYTKYYWVTNNNRLNNTYSTSQSITVTGGTNYRCYLEKSNGNIDITSTAYTTSVCPNNRESAENDEFISSEDGVSLKGYPNPATHDFTIEFDMPFEADFAKIDLMTMTGEVVKVIAQGSYAKGHFTYPMVGKELTSGTYLCRLQINNTVYSTKLVKLGN